MSYKIDLNSVRETYKSMGDEEILAFAREDGAALSTDVYLILKQELKKRDIGKEITDEIDHEIILNYSLGRKKFEEDINTELFVSSLEFALNAKKEGQSQYDIYSGLIERGISEPYASYMVNRLDEWTDKLHKDSIADLQAGVAILILGIIVLYTTLQIEHFVITSFLIIVVGIFRIIGSWNRKKKYRKIIDNIKLDAG